MLRREDKASIQKKGACLEHVADFFSISSVFQAASFSMLHAEFDLDLFNACSIAVLAICGLVKRSRREEKTNKRQKAVEPCVPTAAAGTAGARVRPPIYKRRRSILAQCWVRAGTHHRHQPRHPRREPPLDHLFRLDTLTSSAVLSDAENHNAAVHCFAYPRVRAVDGRRRTT
ncbi:hypothetical protein EVAR_52024_1 [Eumeta japonica]|uniref:Uncharacterized protein n=1 Tax=Eumeta variegata TaxID=151549 RepID=A0A4C1YTE3_EUMVA|nr:hypothetical protein EVAR_52024_1 [Eumeta japonica]